MGRKKFIDKKKSATFQILARDSADPNYDQGPSGDRVFVRVDNNPYSVTGFEDEEEDAIEPSDEDTHDFEDPNSIFADAPEDEDEMFGEPIRAPCSNARAPLPDNIRREILELGFPDDGYNYLLHLREIKNTGGGSTYYENSKAKPDQLSNDVKAYDASRVNISGIGEDLNDSSIYSVAAKTIGARVQKVVDPEVAALLDDDMSRFGSDVEDLEEDFVVQANLLEEGEHVIGDEKINSFEPQVSNESYIASAKYFRAEGKGDFYDETRSHQLGPERERADEQPRVRRLLDEQFDLLTLQEYGTESDSECDGSITAEEECLADKLNIALKDHVKDDLELDGKYKVPADILHENEGLNNGEVVESAAEVIRRCAEYGKMYDNENQDDDDVVILEESSDDAEVWDCETIVSTYSNLDNHPGKIDAPGTTRKKKLAETVSTVLGAGNHVITLRGRGKLPVDYLPHSKNTVLTKIDETPELKSSQQKRKPHGGESKEEKKERKSAVKEERREARRAKKEMKGIYRCEAQRAQKVAAVSGPSGIHLM